MARFLGVGVDRCRKNTRNVLCIITIIVNMFIVLKFVHSLVRIRIVSGKGRTKRKWQRNSYSWKQVSIGLFKIFAFFSWRAVPMGCPFCFISLKSQYRSNYTPLKKFPSPLELLKNFITITGDFWDVRALLLLLCSAFWVGNSRNLQRHLGSNIHQGVVQSEPPLFGVRGWVNIRLNLRNPVYPGAFGPT